MRVKMLETFQERGANAVLVHEGLRVDSLEKGELYDVSATLAAYLIENHKAEAVDIPHYGAQVEPELKQDDVIFEQAQIEPDVANSLPKVKRGRK